MVDRRNAREVHRLHHVAKPYQLASARADRCLEQGVEGPPLADELRGPLRADPLHDGDVVARVADQRAHGNPERLLIGQIGDATVARRNV